MQQVSSKRQRIVPMNMQYCPVVFQDGSLSGSFFKHVPREIYAIIFNLANNCLPLRIVCRQWQILWYSITSGLTVAVSNDLAAFLKPFSSLTQLTLRFHNLYPLFHPRFLKLDPVHPWSKLTELCLITKTEDIKCNLDLPILKSLTSNPRNILRINAPLLSRLTLIGHMDYMQQTDTLVKKHPLLTGLLLDWNHVTHFTADSNGFTLDQLRELPHLEELDLNLLRRAGSPGLQVQMQMHHVTFMAEVFIENVRKLLTYVPNLRQVCFSPNCLFPAILDHVVDLPLADGNLQRLIANSRVFYALQPHSFSAMSVFVRTFLRASDPPFRFIDVSSIFRGHGKSLSLKSVLKSRAVLAMAPQSKNLLALWFSIPGHDPELGFLGLTWDFVWDLIKDSSGHHARILTFLIGEKHLSTKILKQMGPMPAPMIACLLQNAFYLLEALQRVGIVEPLSSEQCLGLWSEFCRTVSRQGGCTQTGQEKTALIYLMKQREMKIDEASLTSLFRAFTKGDLVFSACRRVVKEASSSVVYRAFYLSGRTAKELKLFQTKMTIAAVCLLSPFDPDYILSIHDCAKPLCNPTEKYRFCYEYRCL